MKLHLHCKDFFENMIGLDSDPQKIRCLRRIDLMCLKLAVERFLKSGTKDDAFDVFFCFVEIFEIFGEGYGESTETLLDVLADHEVNAGATLNEHKDHYSHSVYTFAIGIVLYQVSDNFRKDFDNFYKDNKINFKCKCSDDRFIKDCNYIVCKCDNKLLTDCKCKDSKKKHNLHEEFLYRWGMASLFHDIGYPFEIAFKSIREYTAKLMVKFTPQMHFDIDGLIKLNREKKLGEKYEFLSLIDDLAEDINCHDLISEYIVEKLYLFNFDKKDVKKRLDLYIKAMNPSACDVDYIIEDNKLKDIHFLDHAYFSAIIVLKKLLKKHNGKVSKKELEIYVDTAVIILLHAGFWRRELAKYKRAGRVGERPEMSIDKRLKLNPKIHPLAFLLNLCDELQQFDRIGYGIKSKDEPLPKTMYLDAGSKVIYSFSDDALCHKDENDNVDAKFIYKIKSKTMNNILSAVDLEYFNISIDVEFCNEESISSHNCATFFRHILEIAQEIDSEYERNKAIIDGREISHNEIVANWNKLSLELKMSNILAAKSYGDKLSSCGYFFDDRVLNFETVGELSKEQIKDLSKKEHDRWLDLYKSMGWTHEKYSEKEKSFFRPDRKHNCLISYWDLVKNEKDKDKSIVVNLIKNLSSKRKGKTGFFVYDNILNKPNLPFYYVGVAGHRFKRLNDNFDIDKLENALKDEFIKLDKAHENIVLLTSLADGFDIMAAKIAMQFGWTIKAILPECIDEYAKGIENKADMVVFMNLISPLKEPKTNKPIYESLKDKTRNLKYEKFESLLIHKLDDENFYHKDDCLVEGSPTCGQISCKLNQYYTDMSKYIANNCDLLVCAYDEAEEQEGLKINPGGTKFILDLIEKQNLELSVNDRTNIINILKSQLKYRKT